LSSRTSGTIGAFWSAISNVTTNALTFAVTTVLARLLSPQDFGIVGIATVFTAFAQIFLSDTVSEALAQRKTLEPEHIGAAFWSMALLGLVGTTLGIMIAPLAGRIYGEPALAPILQGLSFRLVMDALMTVPIGLLMRKLDFRALALRSALANILGGAAGISIAAGGGGAWALVVQQLVNAAVTLAVLFYYADWRPSLSFSPRHLKDLAGYSFHVAAFRVWGFITGTLDRVLIAGTMDPRTLGFYSLASRTSQVSAVMIGGSVGSVALPLFAGQQDDPKRLSASLMRAADLMTIIGFPAFIGFSVVSPELVPVVFGAKWAEAVPILQVMVLDGALGSLTVIQAAAIRACGRSDWWSWVMLARAIVTICGFVIASQIGVVAVAACGVISAFVVLPVQLWMLRRLLRLDLWAYMARWLPPLVGSGLMTAAILLVRGMSWTAEYPVWVGLIVEILVGALTYAASMAIIAFPRLMQVLQIGLALRRRAS